MPIRSLVRGPPAGRFTYLRSAAMCLIVVTFALCGFMTPSGEIGPPSAQRDPVQSAPISRTWHAVAGRLVRGSASRRPALASSPGTALHRRPGRPGRRWGTDLLVRKVLHVVSGYAASHPSAPRLGIGDLRPPSRGRRGHRRRHASNARTGSTSTSITRGGIGGSALRALAAQIDHRLAQDLVDRFVAAGAVIVFVGPNTELTGPPGVVQVLWNHDNDCTRGSRSATAPRIHVCRGIPFPRSSVGSASSSAR